MTSKFAFLVMLLLVASMVPVSTHPVLEEISIKCGDRCLMKYEAAFQTSSAYPVYKQCVTDCNDVFSE